jgi:hypothetical protein
MAVIGGPRFGIVQDGLVLNLDASNALSYPGTGTDWFDLAENNDGTLLNSPTFNSANGGGIVFDGTDDYIEIDPPLPQATTEITVNVWFKGTGAPSNNDIAGGCLFVGNPGGNHGPFLSYSWANQQVYWGTHLNQTYNVATGFSQNTIHNVCGTFGRPNLKTYKNGVEADSDTQDTNVTYQNSTSGNRIGEWGYGGFQRNFNGQIYSIQVYNRELSSTEVLQNYNALKTRFEL